MDEADPRSAETGTCITDADERRKLNAAMAQVGSLIDSSLATSGDVRHYFMCWQATQVLRPTAAAVRPAVEVRTFRESREHHSLRSSYKKAPTTVARSLLLLATTLVPPRRAHAGSAPSAPVDQHVIPASPGHPRAYSDCERTPLRRWSAAAVRRGARTGRYACVELLRFDSTAVELRWVRWRSSSALIRESAAAKPRALGRSGTSNGGGRSATIDLHLLTEALALPRLQHLSVPLTMR